MKRHRKNQPEPPVKKVRKRRKPMTEEQRAAAIERLAKARAAKKPAQNTSIHESIRDLPEDHDLHPDKVKEWIKDWKLRLKGMRHYANSKEVKEVAKYYEVDGYIKNMQRYLDSGVWLDFWAGPDRTQRVNNICVVPAYDKNGEIKRSYGVYYPDINMVWGIDDEPRL